GGQFGQEYPGQFAQESTDHFRRIGMVNFEGFYTYWEKLQSYLTKITNHCKGLIHAMFFHEKTIEQIQQEYGYSTKHNAQNQKHKCMEQIRKAKEQDKDNA
ncbi:hypothetical protein, partial [Chryseobacterium sp.]|uniref:hypothetical protein n=1 Tax=Chryseobacterium sp. TaxID=1871047 RepID=UPI0025C0E4CF